MISVCIATYNGERYIVEQIKSILCQINSDDEIVISDAGSTDNTVKEIASINDDRIKLLTYNGNTSAPKSSVFTKMDAVRLNFENALSNSKGDIIFLADQDDIWMSNKVQRCLNELDKFDCIIHDCTVINNDKEVLIPSLLDVYKPKESFMGAFVKSPFMGCCMALRRSVLDKALPFPDMHIEYDTWIGICAYKLGKVSVLHEPLIYYRRHGANVSQCAENNDNSLFVKLKRRAYMLLATIIK